MDPERITPLHRLRKQLHKRQSEDIFSQFLAIGSLSGLAALLTFGLHVVMARLLGPESYSVYGTYIAILFTALFSLSGIHLIITRFVSYHRSRHQYEQINYIVTHAMTMLFAGGLVLFGLIVVFAEPISSFFSVERVEATISLGLALWFTMLVPVFEGALKGIAAFRAVGLLRFAEALARTTFAVILVLIGFEVSGAIFGVGVGTVLGLAVTYLPIYRLQRMQRHKPDLTRIRRFAVPVLLTMFCIALLLNMDVILVKHFFEPRQAGFYAAASILAKIPFFISMILVGVSFPKTTQRYVDGKRTEDLLKQGFFVLVPLILVFTFLAFFFAQPIFTLIFGAQYSIGPVLGLYTFAMGCLALTMFLATYLLALQEDSVWLGFPPATLLLAMMVWQYHASIEQVMVSALLVMTVLTSWMLYRARNHIKFDIFL